MDEKFLPNPRPETLSSQVGENRFFALTEPGRMWRLEVDAYRPGTPVFSKTINMEGKLEEQVTSLAQHPSGRFTAAGLKSGAIRLHRDVAAGDEALEKITAFQTRVASLAFSPDGRTLAASDESGSLALWSVADDPLPELSLSVREKGPGPQAVELRDGSFVLADSAGLYRWNPSDITLTPLSLNSAPQRILTLAPGGTEEPKRSRQDLSPLALAQESDARLVWIDLSTRKPLATADLAASRIFQPQRSIAKRISRLTAAFLSSNGKTCALLDQRGKVEFWRLPERTPGSPAILTAEPLPLVIAEPVEKVRYDASGRWALLQPRQGKAFVLDLQHEAPTRREIEGAFIVYDAAGIPGTEALLLATDNGTVRLDCSLKSLGEGDRLSNAPATFVAVSPDGSLALSGGEIGAPTLLDLRQLYRPLGSLAHAKSGDFSLGAVFSADSQRLLGLSRESLRWWQPAPVPSLQEAQRNTGLAVDVDRNVDAYERHPRDILGNPIPPVDPWLGAAWPAIARAKLSVRGFGQSFKDTDSLPERLHEATAAIADLVRDARFARLPDSLRVAARDLAAIATPVEPDFHERHACLVKELSSGWSDAAKRQFYLLRPLSTLADWTGQSRGEWRWQTAMHELSSALEKRTDLFVNSDQDLNPSIQEEVLGAQSEIETARAEGFIPSHEHRLPGPVTSLLNDFETKARAWDDSSEGDAVENKRRAVKWQERVCAFRQSDARAWNRLGINLHNLRTELEKIAAGTQAPNAKQANDEAQSLRRDAIDKYQRSVIEAELSDDANERGYALANWSLGISDLPKDQTTIEQEREYRWFALALSREAIRVAPDVPYVWKTLASRAMDRAEVLQAAEKQVQVSLRTDDLVDAYHTLGKKYREQGLIKKAMDTFQKSVFEKPEDVFALVELGELLRMGGYPLEQCEALFRKATEIDKKKKLADQDAWGQWRSGISYEQWNRLPEAETSLKLALDIFQGNKQPKLRPYEMSALSALGRVLLKQARWEEADINAKQLVKGQMWSGLADVGTLGSLLAKTEEQKAAAAGWLEKVLENTTNDPTAEWQARSTALSAQGNESEALTLVARYEGETPQDERTPEFWIAVQHARARIVAKADPARAVWELAQAAARGWQDAGDLLLDERRDRDLRGVAVYAQLKAALLIPIDAPERFLALARFQFAAAAALRNSGEACPADAGVEAGPRFLADAVRRGWNPSENELRESPFSLVAALPDWPKRLEAARSDAIRDVRADAIALARVLVKASKNKAWKAAAGDPRKQWPLLAAGLVGHAGLKRRAGHDFYGNRYVLNDTTGEVSISPQTRALAAAWVDVDDDYWTVNADSNP